jgi:hypothetical protein
MYPSEDQVLQQIERLENFLNNWEMIPATGVLRNSRVPHASMLRLGLSLAINLRTFDLAQ